MIRRAPAALLLPLLWLPLLSACDDPSPIQGMPLESAGKTLLQLRVVTQLLPNRPTHVAVNRLGHIFWVQETEEGRDMLFMSAETGIPRATRLSTSNIIAALEELDREDERNARQQQQGEITGNIRDIVWAEGGIYFYFYGLRGNEPRAALGQYLPQAGRIRIFAGTAELEKLTGMGRSLDLARASLVASGDRVYLWVRHTDDSVFLWFDPRFIPPVSPQEIREPFQRIVSEGRAIPLTQHECELAPGPEGTLFLLDFTAKLLWQVEPTGAASPRLSLIGLPRGLAPPTATGEQRFVMFAADVPERVGSDWEILQRRDLPKFNYPALLRIDGGEMTAIERDEFRAHAGFPVYAVRLGRLVPEAPQTWVSYDAASGTLMRVRVVETE